MQTAIEGDLGGGFVYEDEDDEILDAADMVTTGPPDVPIDWVSEDWPAKQSFELMDMLEFHAKAGWIPLRFELTRMDDARYRVTYYYGESSFCRGTVDVHASSTIGAVALAKKAATTFWRKKIEDADKEFTVRTDMNKQRFESYADGTGVIDQTSLTWTLDPASSQEHFGHLYIAPVTDDVRAEMLVKRQGNAFLVDLYTSSYTFPVMSWKLAVRTSEEAFEAAKLKAEAYISKNRATFTGETNKAKQWFEEGVVVPAKKHVDEITQILTGRGGKPVEELNAQLAPYDTVIKNHPIFDEYPGCGGGCIGTTFYVNPKALEHSGMSPEMVRSLVSHELVHVGQFKRALANGGDFDKIDARAMDLCRTKGPNAYYNEHPMEVMALAKGAYDAMKDKGMSRYSMLTALRQDKAKNFAPIPIKQHNKLFNKYVYGYLEKDQAGAVVESLLED